MRCGSAFSLGQHSIVKQLSLGIIKQSSPQLIQSYQSSHSVKPKNPSLFSFGNAIFVDVRRIGKRNWDEFSAADQLPRGIGKLINLRHLELEETSSLTELPKGIGKLSSLRTLTKFIVSGDDNNEARNIEMLKNLKHLQGVLCLDGLGNIVSGVEAEKAELKHKEKLIGLTLEFFVQKIEEAMEDHVDDVIEALQPNPNLESLHNLDISLAWVAGDSSIHALQVSYLD
ncbi:putative disease resistance protein [Quercus suber]|uniref:Disease resistance protein n=1 Tax=Quercus suber TaxID=58331 RepID=A0AAW0J9U0_QUESU